MARLPTSRSPLLWRQMTGGQIDGTLRGADPGYAEAEADLGAVLYVLRDLPHMESIEEDRFWPPGLPRPQVDKQGLSHEQQAAFDLTMIATAYLLLHEVRHLIFNADDSRPPPRDEELASDAFARVFLLGDIAAHIKSSGEDSDEVLAKRAAGIALGVYALYEFTPEGARTGTSEYPPTADRLDPLFREVSLPSDHWFWTFVASLLVAVIVSRDRTAAVPDLTGRDLCHSLVDTLRARYQA
jgi:peptidase U49-like protein